MYSFSKDGITVSVMLDTRSVSAKGLYPVKIRVNFNRQRFYFHTGKTIDKNCWEKLPLSKTAESTMLRSDIETSFHLVRENVRYLTERGKFSFTALKNRLGLSAESNLNEAMRKRSESLMEEGRIGSAQSVRDALCAIEKFAGKNIRFSDITVQWLKKCEAFWLQSRSLTTAGIYFRSLRVSMNEAKREGIIKEAQYPFGKGKFEIRTGISRKKALSIDQIKSIFEYQPSTPGEKRYRDLWIFIYLCNGINVADLIRLRFSDIHEGEICFIRQKTERTSRNRKEIRVVITEEIEHIIDSWGNEPEQGGFIFPFLTGNETLLERKEICKDVTKRINKRMKKIAASLGIGQVTTYTARHSFATILQRNGAAISFISESLGHSDLRTTESYLAGFEKSERIKNSRFLTDFSA